MRVTNLRFALVPDAAYSTALRAPSEARFREFTLMK